MTEVEGKMYLNWHTKLNQGRDEQTKLLEIVNKYNTVAEYKINVQKSTNNDISKKRNEKKTISLAIATKTNTKE